MRLLALLPELCVIARPVAQLAAIAVFLGGCATESVPGYSSQFRYAGPVYRPNGPAYADPSKVYLREAVTVEASTKHLSRYACASGGVLVCERLGRVSPTSSCRC